MIGEQRDLPTLYLVQFLIQLPDRSRIRSTPDGLDQRKPTSCFFQRLLRRRKHGVRIPECLHKPEQDGISNTGDGAEH